MKTYLLSLLLCPNAFAQTAEATLSGTITDAVNHQPIAGARIFYQNANTTSDSSGAWSLHIKPNPDDTGGRLAVSKIGYEPRIIMKPGGSETRNIEMTPAAHISGHLVDRDSGNPLPGFLVIAHPAQNPAGVGYNSNLSGEDGAFAIGVDLQSGGYVVEISPPSGRGLTVGKDKPDDAGYGRCWFPGVPRIEMAAPVTVSAGENRVVEIRLQKRELHHIAGVVQAPDGREGERISINVTGVGGGQIVAEEIPKAGPFRIDGLDEGSYEISATLSGPAHAFAIKTIEVTDRHVDDLKLDLRPGVSVRATITMAEKDVEVPNGTGMWLGPMPFSPAHALGASSATQSSDHLYWQGLPAGEYWPMLMLPNGYAVASVTYNERPVFNSEIDIEAPESTVNFVVTSRPLGLAGTVRDSDQRPVPEAAIALLPEPLPEAMEKFNFFALQIADSDANGVFHFSGLAPGRYKAIPLMGKDRQREHDLDFLRDRSSSVEAVELDRGQTSSIDLHIK
jgi:hypothetical protein